MIKIITLIFSQIINNSCRLFHCFFLPILFCGYHSHYLPTCFLNVCEWQEWPFLFLAFLMFYQMDFTLGNKYTFTSLSLSNSLWISTFFTSPLLDLFYSLFHLFFVFSAFSIWLISAISFQIKNNQPIGIDNKRNETAQCKRWPESIDSIFEDKSEEKNWNRNKNDMFDLTYNTLSIHSRAPYFSITFDCREDGHWLV